MSAYFDVLIDFDSLQYMLLPLQRSCLWVYQSGSASQKFDIIDDLNGFIRRSIQQHVVVLGVYMVIS
jgi:hypothetical protein